MQISSTVLNAMLNGEFNTVDGVYYLILTYSAGTSDAQVIDFSTASDGVVNLAASKFFVITSGTTITGLQVYRIIGAGPAEVTQIIETFPTAVVYATDGTFTVNDITVSVAVAV